MSRASPVTQESQRRSRSYPSQLFEYFETYSQQTHHAPRSAGITAPLTLSLKYAAPETIAALEAGCRTIHVDAAVDIWAIGVIAFELLTGERVFPVRAGESQEACDERVKAGIAGRLPLPWEPNSEGKDERLLKMRGLKRTVRVLLLPRSPMSPMSEWLASALAEAPVP